jgi:hypothetical protein
MVVRRRFLAGPQYIHIKRNPVVVFAGNTVTVLKFPRRRIREIRFRPQLPLRGKLCEPGADFVELCAIDSLFAADRPGLGNQRAGKFVAFFL